jgi:two-component system response regulator AtoC
MNYALLGNHPAIQKIRELINLVSDTYFNVLIAGETGTGKEVVARLLHDASPRKKERFIKVNCAALPLTLLESELFGYEKGAFTGADKLKLGKFELASEGVIFLDEIADMSLPLQAKLLEVLQSGKFNRLGGTRDVKVNSWVISSTNHALEQDIRQTRFREDLFYRLNIIRIDIPPLRERRGDIPLLSRYFLERHGKDLNSPKGYAVPRELMRLFEIYHWPGNVRELSSTILRLMVGDEPDVITSEFVANMNGDGLSLGEEILPSRLQSADTGKSAVSPSHMELKSEATRFIEREAILYALAKADGNKRAAARLLQVSFKTLYTKMENLGISKEKEALQR